MHYGVAGKKLAQGNVLQHLHRPLSCQTQEDVSGLAHSVDAVVLNGQAQLLQPLEHLSHLGDAQARSLAAVLGVPCFASTHQRGHIYAARVGSGIALGDLLAVHLSGGTTEVLSLRGEDLTLLGGTADLHAGQLVDRAGVAMGLPFPAGPYLEELARRGRSAAKLPVSMEKDRLAVHLSGAETQVQRWIRAEAMPREDIAREIYDFLARTVSRLVLGAAEKTGIAQTLIAGGVASSALFRELLTSRVGKQDPSLRVCFGRPEYSGDNAVGAALIGAEKWRRQHDLHED